LRERTGIDNGYRVCGGLEFLHTGAHAADEEWHGVGIRLQKLDEAQTRQREPSVASGLGPAIHLPDLAQLRNPRHMKALIAVCQATGRVELRHGVQVFALKTTASRVDGVETSAGLLKAEQYLLAAGRGRGRCCCRSAGICR
jgi:glycine oxidase